MQGLLSIDSCRVLPTETGPSGSSASERRPRLYVVALSHLDTQWRWTVRETADSFLPRTVRENEDRFERFPHYRLNFEGAHRYRLLEECHPDLFARVRSRVAEGRWFPSGAAWEAFDTNLPAPESIVRQILLGTRYLERAVGRAGRDLFLPDCFGFSQALPTLAAHCGIVGFSTQKLRRGREMRSAFGVPFPFGVWIGPDGSALPAVLDPGEYGAQATSDLSSDPEWIARFRAQAEGGGPNRLMTYQGLGDKGGALPPAAIGWLERARTGTGPIAVLLADSEEIFRDLDPETRARLPVYDGELLLRLHATGCYSSRSQLKRWHRKAEQLAHAAERAAAIAHTLGVRTADRERLREAWLRILAHEMHDDLTGTSLVEAYRYSANDLALSLNELEQELAAAVGAVATTLDSAAVALRWWSSTLSVGSAPISSRSSCLLPNRSPKHSPSSTSDGREVPSQWRLEGDTWRGCFVRRSPSLGFSVFDLRAAVAPAAGTETKLSVGDSFLENEALRVEIDANGDIARILDKRDARELLAAPIGLEIFDNFFVPFSVLGDSLRGHLAARPQPPRRSAPDDRRRARRRARRAVDRARRRGLTIPPDDLPRRRRGRRPSGDRHRDRLAHRRRAAQDGLSPVDAGGSRRIRSGRGGGAPAGRDSPELYEVPAQQWAALRAANGAGAAIANDCKYGWDHPTADTLRLTLLHTPRIGRRFRYQARQDFGQHEVRVAIAPIRASDSLAEAVRFAERINQPLRAYVPPAGASPEPANADDASKPRSFSFLTLNSDEVAVQALKLAEEGDEVILRLREIAGDARSVSIQAYPRILSVRAGRRLRASARRGHETGGRSAKSSSK